MALLPHDNLSWLVGGEKPTGSSVTTSPVANLNRPLNELLDNDKDLQDQINILADLIGSLL